MPALHRMPVFYAALLLVAAVVGIGSLRRHTAKPHDASESARLDALPPTTVARPKASAPPPAPEPDDGILRTADGLRRKVVVRALDLTCRSEPTGGSAVGPPLDYFAIRYVYGEAPGADGRMFQVGTREGPPQGWIPESGVLPWDTRLMARPAPRGGRPALVLYREESCLLDALAGRTCPKHSGGRCPIEGEEAERPNDADTPAAGMPILQSKAIPQPGGSTRTFFEVASLVHDRAAPRAPREPSRDMLPALRRIDVAFVIDTTASMQASLDAVRRFAERLVAESTRRYQDVRLHLALIEYRDAAPEYGFRTRATTDFTDPAGFREVLTRVGIASHRDGSVDESVLDGVAAALPPTPEDRSPALAWPTGRIGELATKLIVLIGDAPDHDTNLDRARTLAERARREGISIAAVAIDRPDLRTRDEEARYRDQWRSLAEGSYRPRDRATGFRDPMAPIVADLSNADRLSEQLRSILDDRIEHARKLAALAAAEAEDRLQEYVNSQGLTLDQVHPVLVDLHRGEPEPEARPDPRYAGRRAPSVRRGWIAERSGDARLVSVEVLMSRTELDAVIAELIALQRAAQGTARDVGDLLRIGTAAAAGETAFLAADRGDLTFAEHLRRRQGLPPGRPDGLLNRTQADLLQADDSYRRALDARLGAAVQRLVRRRDSADWDNPKRLIEGMGLVPYDAFDF